MKCPNCPEATLIMSTRQEIEIDYCPQCRGVWLDRGELDKIIERSTAPTSHNQNNNNYYKKSDDDYKKDQQYKRKKSFLSEIFD